MEGYDVVPFKIFLSHGDSEETEVRRFGMPQTSVTIFSQLQEMIVQIFPSLLKKSFSINWKDEDGDYITISTDMELIIALTEMQSNVKHFYVKVKNVNGGEKTERCEMENTGLLHPMIFCDQCEQKIRGFRYKCVICKDYDLCNACDKNGAHAEHPMLRIPNPNIFDRSTIHKLMRVISFVSSQRLDDKKHHSRRKHCSENFATDSHKKKKHDKHESGHETDDSEEGAHKRHGHGKSKKANTCPCKYSFDDYLQYLGPFIPQVQINQQESVGKSSNNTTEEPSHAKYLKSIGRTIAALLNPLGIDVDIEVRPSCSKEENEKAKDTETKKESSESDDISATKKQQKEVHFDKPQMQKETVDDNGKKNKIPANQKTTESPERDDWVSLEELKQYIVNDKP